MSSNKLGMMDSIVEGEDDPTGIIEAIPKDKAEDLLEIIRSGMKDDRKSAPSEKYEYSKSLDSKEYIPSSDQTVVSIADELQKLVKLKEERILTEEEFNHMKQGLIKNHKK